MASIVASVLLYLVSRSQYFSTFSPFRSRGVSPKWIDRVGLEENRTVLAKFQPPLFCYLQILAVRCLYLPCLVQPADLQSYHSYPLWCPSLATCHRLIKNKQTKQISNVFLRYIEYRIGKINYDNKTFTPPTQPIRCKTKIRRACNIFPALGIGYMFSLSRRRLLFSRALWWLHVFPRFCGGYIFSSVCAGYNFSRFTAVTCFRALCGGRLIHFTTSLHTLLQFSLTGCVCLFNFCQFLRRKKRKTFQVSLCMKISSVLIRKVPA